jgi:carbonic anhydrase/acetyltransferase-like protein (isoleucine patch superfamily)
MIAPFENRVPTVPSSAWVHESAQLIGSVTLGANASVWPCAVLRADIAAITVGRGSNIQDGAVLHVDFDLPCEIGEYCVVGHRAVIHGAKIGNECLIGMGAIVLNKAVLGDHCLIGAGSVVPEGKTIPEGSLALGVPAKVIRPLSPEEIASIRQGAEEYINLSRSHRRA